MFDSITRTLAVAASSETLNRTVVMRMEMPYSSRHRLRKSLFTMGTCRRSCPCASNRSRMARAWSSKSDESARDLSTSISSTNHCKSSKPMDSPFWNREQALGNDALQFLLWRVEGNGQRVQLYVDSA